MSSSSPFVLPRDEHEAFGQLRALMQHEALTPDQQDALLALLIWASTSHPLVYQDRWLDYMAGFGRHFEEALTTIESFAALEAFFAHTPIARLELELNGTTLDAKTLRKWARSPALECLTALRLRRCEIDDEGAEALLRSAHLKGVHQLDLSSNRLSVQAMRALLDAPHFSSLSSLSLSYNYGLGDEATRLLASSPLCGQLASLRLASCSVTIAGCRALAAAPLDQIRHLRLGSNDLEDEAIGVVASAPWFSQLREFDCNNNGITDAGVAAIAASTERVAMHTLDLSFNELGAEGVEALMGQQSPCRRSHRSPCAAILSVRRAHARS